MATTPARTRGPRRVDAKGRVSVNWLLPEALVKAVEQLAEQRVVHPQRIAERALTDMLADALPADVVILTTKDVLKYAATLDVEDGSKWAPAADPAETDPA